MSTSTGPGSVDLAPGTSPIPIAVRAEPRGRWSPGARVAASVAAEALVAVLAAAWLLLLTRTIVVDPTDRIGQVSGLAGIGLRFSLTAMVVLAVVLVSHRVRSGRWSPLVTRLACAAMAGLATGFVASGVLVALDGTTWPLNGDGGDAGQLQRWIVDLQAGRSMPASYPPLAVHLMAWWGDVTGTGPAGGVRAAQVIGTALFGPATYLAWRSLLTPPWALALGLTAALVLVDPYKPYAPMVLAALVPVLLKFFSVLRRAASASWRQNVVAGLLAGGVLGLLFLTYSGWFVWSAVGAVAAVLVVFPWRSGPLRGLVLLAVTGVTFAVVSAGHLIGLLSASGSVKDQYFYFDVLVEPAYIAMWRGDAPGDTGPWPPPGELGGVGLFSVLLVIGLGVAIWLAGRRTVVIGLALFVAGAWILRFWFAAQMYETQSVQLYPRTTQEILYCSLLLVGFAVMAGAGQLRALVVTLGTRPDDRGTTAAAPASGRGRAGLGQLGVFAAFSLLALFVGSATADRYMPRNDDSVGRLAYIAQMVRQPDGTCPEHSGPDGCAAVVADLAPPS